MAKYLDNDGLLYFWQKIKNLFATKDETVKSITRSGTTFTATRADGTTFTFTQQDNTVAKTTTTPKANGTAAIGSETKYAAGDHVHPLQTTVSGNAGSATKLQTARTIDGVSFDGQSNIIHYGTCDTAAGTVAKVVDCEGFTLKTGAWIAVKFMVTNTGAVESLTLNVNGTGAKGVKYRNVNLSTGVLVSNRVYLFVYDGTNYQVVGDLDTNTVYSDATTSAHGLMSADDKTKLDSIAMGAEINQNAFSKVVVGSTTIAADTKTDTLTLAAGSNVTLTPDATNDKVTINAVNTTYGDATTSTHGLMSVNDKKKLDKLSAYYYLTLDTAGTMKYFLSAVGTDGSTSNEIELMPKSDMLDTFAKKTDLAGMYKYMGSVANEAALPTTGVSTGDVYNIETASSYGGAGANVAWNGTAWDSLGEIFTINTITNSEIDTIVAS